MTVQWYVLVLAVVALARSCGGGSEPGVSPETACRGSAAPVREQQLVDTLARYGFELSREDTCVGAAGEPAAMFTNIPESIFDKPEADVIFASDSQVWCELYAQSRFTGEVRRTRLVEEEEVAVRVHNVECRIYEVDAWHVERLALALKRLALDVP